MTDTEEVLREEDAVSMVKLIGDVAGMDEDVPHRKRELMRGLKELTNADGWLWSVTCCDYENTKPVCIGVIHEGLTDEQFQGWVEASQTASPPPPEDVPLEENFSKGKHFTRTRAQMVPDELWYGNPTIQKYRIERGIDDFIYSIYPFHETTCSAIGLFRHVGRERFSARERRIAHIILANVTWLHTAGLPDADLPNVPNLTPTQRIVLVHLLEGKRRSEIGKLMGVAESTVKDHTRAVLRHYDVPDQLALVCRFTAGNRNDETN